ncbi:hypothetical protein CKAH01_06451 [Colletotrichum kahawae]|uniref:Uncharacterized protein n=1 Tax=Colletotrichum kahawae TaxID=34407 RepID=A0AAD9Y896_COLKA|nr:hypothetical protein CKAH01_06451 [Colletotrichum kahawae]
MDSSKTWLTRTFSWLPITPGGATISATLYWCGAEEYMANGSHVYPEISTIDATRLRIDIRGLLPIM